MLHGIVMNVIDMSIHVFLIPDDVIPETALPNGALTAAVSFAELVGKGQFQASENTG
jgi:hypothetical protein